MPYQSNQDLPASIKDHLPQEAQTVFRKVFNSAYQEYETEEQAFRVAWAAVKKQYEKNDHGIWVKK